MTDELKLSWQDPDWQRQAHEWIRAEASRRSIRLTGEIEQPHMYPWSTVLRVPTDQGTLFFKATAAETVYEAALTQKLASWVPDCMPELVAVDPLLGWMLMRDGGEQLRASIRPKKDVTPWNLVITRYAEVQVGLTEHALEILNLGVPDHRLASLPALYTRLLKDEDILLIDQEKGPTSDEWEQLKDTRPRFERICEKLANVGIPESLNHGDFHDGNVLVRDGRITFFDWGDASVTHPFVSLRTLFVSVEIALDLDDYSFTPEMAALLE
ncbi:MAG TPA: phosphotransferase, partial [Anaerolineales bacterium]|nr:phosphotransferase [Anaerolineales bacterium]